MLLVGVAMALAAACGGSPDVRVDDSAGGTSSGGSAGSNGEGGSANTGNTGATGSGGNPIMGGNGGGGTSCTPTTCEELGANCGRAPDGCGAVLECGECDDGEICGFSEANVCSTDDDFDDLCVPISRDDACEDKECGVEGDGCGDTYECGECEDDEVCGLREAFQCDAPDMGNPDDCPARIESCEEVGAECGFVGNGCGGVIDCAEELGAGCASGETCIDGECVSGTTDCDPIEQSVACAGKECGAVSDGCGDVVDCGACGTGEMCGVQAAYQCDVMTCVPRDQTAACAGKECGTVYDGCGTAAENTFNCGSCPTGEFCGLNTAFQCDAPQQPTCTPTATTCAGLGWACGQAIDNCGNVYNCAAEGRECGPLEVCVGGVGGTPTTCMGSGGGNCPLCNAVPDCSGQPLTALTGRVITPGQNDGNTANQVGVPNAFVYILRTNDLADLPSIGSGIPSGADGESCDRCDEQNLGPVLAGAVTDATGAFRLEGNVPVGQEFILVTKVGKFRRATRMTLAGSAACATTPLATAAATNPTRLPRTMADGLGVNIPRVAITTGQIDAMECVFWKMGLATSEFAVGSSTTTGARLHLYRGGSSSGSASGAHLGTGSTPYDTDLYGSQTRMRSYDMVVADCEGQTFDSSFSQRTANGANVRDYVNRGGRMFASHLSFSWLYDNGSDAYATGAARFNTGLAPAATWQTSAVTGPDNGTGIISVGRPLASPRIDNFASWMVNEGVTTAPNYNFTIREPRSQASALGTSTEEFVHCDGGDCNSNSTRRTQQFSFNTPYAAPANAACGRVAYSGFHVSYGGGSTPYANVTFPNHCQGSNANNGNLTDQEKVLLYMLFDLGACVGDEPDPPECTPVACPAYPACGTRGDGCGGTQNCGCPSGEACISGTCQPQGCVPTTCEAEGVTCANISDGCGNILPCDCPGCDRQSCDDVGAECGMIGDGCGGALDCGPCPAGQVCTSVGGVPNQCFGCDPRSCDDVDAECGLIGDGCGGTADCGPCPPGQICGAQSPNECGGGNECDPLTCEEADAECGVIGNGCGGSVDCGPCPAGQVCGIEEAFRCDPPPGCTPKTCDDLGDNLCGIVGDGCGDVVDCGECAPGETCGAFEPNKCGVIR